MQSINLIFDQVVSKECHMIEYPPIFNHTFYNL